MIGLNIKGTIISSSLLLVLCSMINGAPVVHAQFTFPAPQPPTTPFLPPPTTPILPIQPPLLTASAQYCVNNGTNVLGPKDNGKQILNQENQCTGTPKNVNQLPVANVGPSQRVSSGSLVTLDGSGSFAQNGATIVSYSWVQTTGTSVGGLPNTAIIQFTAPQNSTTLAFTLTVTDSRGAISSPSSAVFISVR